MSENVSIRTATDKAGIYKSLAQISIPTMLGMLGPSLYDVVDLIWVGRISEAAIAGATIFSAVFWFVEILNEIIGVSSMALITQTYGAGKYSLARRVIEQTITFKMLVAVIAAVPLAVFLQPVIKIFTSDPAALRAAMEYGFLRVLFLPVFFASYSCFTALRCIGDPRSPMWIMLGGAGLNAIISPIFMFSDIPFVHLPGIGLGVFGASLGTVISIVLTFMAGFILLMRRKGRVRISLRGLFTLDAGIDKKLLMIGLPSGAETLSRQLANLVTLKFIAYFGAPVVAAYGIAIRFFGLIFVPLWGIMMGCGTLVGQNMGAGDVQRAEKTAHAAALFGGTLIAAVMIVAVAFPGAIASIFVDSAEIRQISATMLRILCLSFIPIGYALCVSGAFSGSGHNMPYLIASGSARWAVQIPILALSFFALPTIGIEFTVMAVWLSFFFSDFTEASILFYHFFRGRWKAKKVIEW